MFNGLCRCWTLQHYEKLKCEMDVVDEGSVEYQHIQSYLENTHAATHSNYKLDLQQVLSSALLCSALTSV